MVAHTHYLYPSTLYGSTVNTEVTTILGSCISVCIFDPVSKIGGINHFMLPLWNGEGLASPKYGDIAIDKLVQKLISLGASQRMLQAKIFGGADSNSVKNIFQIGRRNYELAFSYLEFYNIPILGNHVGGHLPRKLIYNTGTGEALLKVLCNENIKMIKAQ